MRRTEDNREYTRGQYLYGSGAFDPTNNCPGNIYPITMVAKAETCFQKLITAKLLLGLS